MAARGLAMSIRAQQGMTRKDLAEPRWKHDGFIHCANYREGAFLTARRVYTMSREKQVTANYTNFL
jgi:hypothetical protein